MPEKITRNASGGYTVTGPHGVHAKNTTKEKAEAQKRLLNAVEHGFEPNKKGNFSSRTEATDEMAQTLANEERRESRATERKEQRGIKGATRGNRSGGEMGEFHTKRSKL